MQIRRSETKPHELCVEGRRVGWKGERCIDRKVR
jgi:hypothetical protein